MKFFCEFFFTNFWHFIGLLFLVGVVFGNINKIFKK